MSMKHVIPVGSKFGRWTVLDETRTAKGKLAWRCRCECGTERVVVGTSLRRGASRSCGCWSSEVSSRTCVKRCKTHGKTGTRAFRTWSAMLDRCRNQRSSNYPRWGQRGIRVCERWASSFENFYADMGDPPDGATLDRIDNDGDYCPDNCRWANGIEQSRNRPGYNRMVTYCGVTATVAEWAQRTGLSYSTIWQRINAGWPVNVALTKPARRRRACR